MSIPVDPTPLPVPSDVGDTTTKHQIAIDIISDAVSWPHANRLLRALARLSISTSQLELIALILHINAPQRAVTLSLLDTAPVKPALIQHLQGIWNLLQAISAAYPSYDALLAPPGIAPLRLQLSSAVYTYSAPALLARCTPWLPLITEFHTLATAKYTLLTGLSVVIEDFAAGSTTITDIRHGANPRWTALLAFLGRIPAAAWLLQECAVWAADLNDDEPEFAEAGLNSGILPRLRAFAGTLHGRADTMDAFGGVLDALGSIREGLLGFGGAGTPDVTALVTAFDWVVPAWGEMREECTAVAEDFIALDWAACSADIIASPLLATMRLPIAVPPLDPSTPPRAPLR